MLRNIAMRKQNSLCENEKVYRSIVQWMDQLLQVWFDILQSSAQDTSKHKAMHRVRKYL
jgi:hypothetical protein